eukprot:scaffold27.g5987.t1
MAASALSIDDPPYSRLFVVVGRNTSAEYLREVFSSLGTVSFVKYLREKGVAYVKYDRASSAALAIETLHEVTLNDGQGPRLKVILADSPHTRTLTALQPRRPLDDETPGDPDNTPARSRLFMVVPKSADGSLIEAEMARFSGMQYCKTDLIATKGIVFVKYGKSSAACLAMETIQETGMTALARAGGVRAGPAARPRRCGARRDIAATCLTDARAARAPAPRAQVAGYKVKVMLAEPKSRRSSPEGMPYLGLGAARGSLGPQGLLAGMGMPGAYGGAGGGASLLTSLTPGLMGQGLGLPDYTSLQSAVGAIGSGTFGGVPATMGRDSAISPPLPPLDAGAALSSQVSLAGFGLGGLGNGVSSFGGLGGLGGPPPPMGAASAACLLHPITPSASTSSSTTQLSRTRLFVVVHKSIDDEALARMFRSFPGMEYCDLKKDRGSGRSKGYAYVNYGSAEAAAAAQVQLNGIEFPPASGYRLKVMFAEPQGTRVVRSGSDAGSDPGPASYLHSPSEQHQQQQTAAAHQAAAQQQQAGLQQLMAASPQDTSTTIQLHTPMTGESGVVLQGGGYVLSGEPSPASREPGTVCGPSPHSSPLRPGMGALLDSADLAAVQSSLASISLAQENGGLGNGMHSVHQSPISAATRSIGAAEGTASASSWHAELSPADPALPHHPRSTSVSPIKPLAIGAAASPAAAAADATVVYSALSRPLPDYALTHVFSQVGKVEYVRVLADDRVAMVKYATPDGARAAVGSLNGTEVGPAPAAAAPATEQRSDIRNIAIIAHVDHGKTTLVDAMLKQAKVFRGNQAVDIRVMDSYDLERERGITILSKNTAVRYKGVKINIIDTPGHADFGGEVERVLNMADGVLLLVDSVEGPMPQTRFVLRKALELEKKVVVVVNKVDRPAARPDWVIDQTFELFLDLGASDEQCDFPVVYASGIAGIAGDDPADLADDLEPLFEAILREVQPPRVAVDVPLQLLVTNLDYDEHKGRIAIGRVQAGKLSKGDSVAFCKPGDDKPRSARISELFVYDNFARTAVDEVEAGDICAVTGLAEVGGRALGASGDGAATPAGRLATAERTSRTPARVLQVAIGETLCNPGNINPLPTIEVEEPTVRMTFSVNTSPFAGQEGKYVTSRNLKERLERELERNLALRVEPGSGADSFDVSGRGSLHLGILMENMRREGYEFAVGPPKVITRRGEGGDLLEPVEEAVIEVPEEHVGGVVDLMGQRKAQMLDMSSGSEGASRLKYKIPTRGLLGLRNAMLTATKGTAVLNTIVAGYEPWAGEIQTRETGSLVCFETGQVTAYALEGVQQRGRLFTRPGEQVYEGQVIGIHQRSGDLKVNACKKKALTNMRAAGKDANVVLSEPVEVNLDYALEFIASDELVEVTPKSIRMQKNPSMGKRK